MDHLLIVALSEALPASFLGPLRQAGWRVSVTADVLRAKQFLQRGDIDAIIIEFNPDGSTPDRMKVLRYVHESCPGTLVVMLNSGASLFKSGEDMARSLNIMDDTRSDAKPQTLDLYHLTPAQKRIAELVAQAYPNREIARQLKIKEQSVRNELSRIFKKMGVWNRVELALLMRNGSPDTATAASSTRGEDDFPATWPAETKPPNASSGSVRLLT